MNRNIRTDLAIELHEDIDDDEDSSGISIDTRINKDTDIKTTVIDVTNKKGMKLIGKPIGTYITIECDDMDKADESIHEALVKELAYHIKALSNGAKSILVAGLGNRMVTPDSLGPLVVDNLYITRHLKNEQMLTGISVEDCIELSGIAPGVTAQTGIETASLLKAVCDSIKPELIIVIDALAARSSKRLNRTIQLTDTGISPGSGIGNNRKALTRDNMGTRVVAIGVPTVISVPAIISDSIDRIFQSIPPQLIPEGFNSEDEEKRYYMAYSMLDQSAADMFVTPKNIDELLKRISFTISEAINKTIVSE